MEYKIEKDLNINDVFKTRKSKYPFKDMEVGNSFVFPIKKRYSVYPCAVNYCKRNNLNWKFSVVKVSDTEGRIFRTI